jgi:murein DD-endopeptidase MepM/ murein hydrolase activator NlpD
VRLRKLLLICSLTIAAACSPATALAGTGGAQSPEQPFLGAVRDSSSGGATPADGEGGGATVGDRGPRTGRGVRARRRTRSRRRTARRQQRSRRERRRHGSGGVSPRAPLPAPEPAPRATPEAGHRFPVAGPFDLGGAGARFGAPRSGHTHQGQDISAAAGTPVVAPWVGIVEWVRFQRRGAGWYVVLDGDDEDRDYVFMHLRRGSIAVVPGQHVNAGDQLGQVGSTGDSSGPHLHFEIWVGGWYASGGAPIDPLPSLQAWIGL